MVLIIYNTFITILAFLTTSVNNDIRWRHDNLFSISDTIFIIVVTPDSVDNLTFGVNRYRVCCCRQFFASSVNLGLINFSSFIFRSRFFCPADEDDWYRFALYGCIIMFWYVRSIFIKSIRQRTSTCEGSIFIFYPLPK